MNHSGLVDLVQITNPEDLGTGLPPSTSEDAGKVLKVASDGVPGWSDPTGGTEYTAGTGIDIDNGEISVDNTVALKTDIPAKGSLMVKAGTTQKELYDAWAAGWTIQSNRGNELNVYELTHFEHEFDEYTAIFSRVYFADALIYEDSFAIDGITDSTSAVTFGSKTTKTSNRVPAADSQTVGRVLTIKSVPDDDPIASWETPATVTVDQNYNAASTNAQSGVAVAQAIAALPTPETITIGYKEI